MVEGSQFAKNRSHGRMNDIDLANFHLFLEICFIFSISSRIPFALRWLDLGLSELFVPAPEPHALALSGCWMTVMRYVNFLGGLPVFLGIPRVTRVMR